MSASLFSVIFGTDDTIILYSYFYPQNYIVTSRLDTKFTIPTLKLTFRENVKIPYQQKVIFYYF